MWRRVYRYLFGDDVFISYSRKDGASYATALASELAARGLFCRFDQWGAPPDKSIPSVLVRALLHSGMLVVVGTEEAGRSSHVAAEISIFVPTRRFIVPIDLDGSLPRASWWPLLEGLAISAPDPMNDVVERICNTRTFTRRDRRLRRAFAFASFLLLLLLVASGFAAYTARDKAAEALVAARAAEANRREAARQAEIARIRRLANQSLFALGQGPNAMQEALNLAVEAGRRADRLGVPVLEADTAVRAVLDLLPRPAGPKKPDTRPGGQVMSANSNRIAEAGPECQVEVTDPATNTRWWVHPARDRCFGFHYALSPDGRSLAASFNDGAGLRLEQLTQDQAGVWDVESGTLHELSLGDLVRVSSIAFSPSGTFIIMSGLTLGLSGQVMMWRFVTGEPDPAGAIAQKERLSYAATDDNGRYVGTITDEGAVTVWESGYDNRYTEIARLPPSTRATGLFFNDDGTLSTVSATGTSAIVRRWDFHNNSEALVAGIVTFVRTENAWEDSVSSHDGRFVAHADDEGLLQLRDTRSGSVRSRKHLGRIERIEFSADSRLMMAGETGRFVVVYDTATLDPIAQWSGSTDVAFSADRRFLGYERHMRFLRIGDLVSDLCGRAKEFSEDPCRQPLR